MQTFGEEVANSLSHGLGFILAGVSIPFLILAAIQRSSVASIVGVAVFGGTMVILYLVSSLYHALPQGRLKQTFQVLDHMAIFILIAGTYTPFTLGVLWGAWGWTLFGLVWGMAAVGIALKAMGSLRMHSLSTLLYVVMGWIALIALKPLLVHVPASGLRWLLAGGLAYTGGVFFYAIDYRRYAHFVWHLFVLMGTGCHFIAVLNYSA